MLYLTQIAFDCDLVTRLGIRDAYDWHQRVWECFPGRNRQPRDFLTRLEDKGDHFRLLVLSPTPPTRPAWCPANAWNGTKEIDAAYVSHRRYRFQLCANPTRKVKAFNPDGTERRQGRRKPLRTREELVRWIQRKGEAGGFSVDPESLRTLRRGWESFVQKGRHGLHNSVEFRGILSVTDTDRFRKTLARGVGSAKAFGFGLLAIAPCG